MVNYYYLGKDIRDSDEERKSFQDWSKQRGQVIYNIDALIKEDPYLFEKVYTLDEFRTIVDGGD